MNLETKITTKQITDDKGVVWWTAVLSVFDGGIPQGEVELGTMRSGLLVGELEVKRWVQFLSIGVARIIAEVAQGMVLKQASKLPS